jgi:DnaJ family protein C protein 3
MLLVARQRMATVPTTAKALDAHVLTKFSLKAHLADVYLSETSPADPSLYYKRATALFSAQRYDSAMSDFDHVLSLTSDSFDKAHFMRARILAKEGRFSEAKEVLKAYQVKVPADPSAADFLLQLSEAEAAAIKMEGAMKAKLWTACEEAATTALITASHAVSIRKKRAYCALAAGDYEQALGDLSCVIVLVLTRSV